jgi:hypothetical protein
MVGLAVTFFTLEAHSPQSHETRDSVKALLSGEVGSGAT